MSKDMRDCNEHVETINQWSYRARSRLCKVQSGFTRSKVRDSGLMNWKKELRHSAEDFVVAWLAEKHRQICHLARRDCHDIYIYIYIIALSFTFGRVHGALVWFGQIWSGCKSAKRLKDWQLSTLRLGGWNMLKRFRRVVRTRRITPIPHMKHPPETMDNNDDTTDDWDITGTMGCMGHGMWISGVGRWICSLVATLMNMIWWLVRGTPPQKYPEPPKLSLVN